MNPAERMKVWNIKAGDVIELERDGYCRKTVDGRGYKKGRNLNPVHLLKFTNFGPPPSAGAKQHRGKRPATTDDGAGPSKKAASGRKKF